jgi:hypothetical protein
MAGALHNGSAGGALSAHEQGYPYDSLIADDGDLSGRAILHDVQKRNDTGGREVNVAHRNTRLTDRVPQRHRHELQMGKQPLAFFFREGLKQEILAGVTQIGCSLVMRDTASLLKQCALSSGFALLSASECIRKALNTSIERFHLSVRYRT